MRAQVYRNLNSAAWSIRQRVNGRWLVVSRAQVVRMTKVTVRHSESGRQKVLQDGRRNVHCWAVGEIQSAAGVEPYRGRNITFFLPKRNTLPWRKGARQVIYNPKKHRTLTYADTGSPFVKANAAVFKSDGTMWVDQ